jgi:hydroxymethylpyrimidine/phosphomethylpyrimidine kinase
VAGVHFLPADFVVDQIDMVLSDYGAVAIKTGFIGRVEIIEAIADRLVAYKPKYLVVDPVLVNHRDQPMFSPLVTRAYIDLLFPLADLVTPNQGEAGLLMGGRLESGGGMADAAQAIHELGPRWVLIKGDRQKKDKVDLLFNGREEFHLRTAWIDTQNTHGSGDTFSAAVCAFLAHGESILSAVEKAHKFTASAIEGAAKWGLGAGHGPVKHW